MANLELASARTLGPSALMPTGPMPSSGCAQNHRQGLRNSFSGPTPELQHQIHWSVCVCVGGVFSASVHLTNSHVTQRCSSVEESPLQTFYSLFYYHQNYSSQRLEQMISLLKNL